MLKNIFLATFILFITACSTAPVPEPEREKPLPLKKPDIVTQTDTLAPPETKTLVSKQQDLEQDRLISYVNKDWARFIELTEWIWSFYSEEAQAALLQDSFEKLMQLEEIDLIQFTGQAEHPLQAWLWLVETQRQTGLNQKRALEDLSQITQGVSFNPQLINLLTDKIEQQLKTPEHIAVLVPLSGRLGVVGKQIRSGILKHYWHIQSSSKLRFYDTNQSDNLSALYQTALDKGATKIIGPLTRQEIEQLNQLAGPELIALNRIDDFASFHQLSLRSTNEVEQIIDHLETHCYQHVALVHSNLSSDNQMAQDLQASWKARQRFELTHHRYPQNSNNLRNELNKVLNIQHSLGRAGFLSRVIEQSIEHEPRSRQDLQAMVLIGDEQRIAIFQPHLDFYQLTLPVIGTSILTPSQLNHSEANRDLKNIQFPTYPATLVASPLNNSLEALGWDGFLLANHLHQLEKGMFIHGALGKHLLAMNNQIHTQLSWARYQSNGQLVSLHPQIANDFYSPRIAQPGITSEPNSEKIRQQLLDEINQFELFEQHAN